MQSPPALDIDALLEQESWARRLARALVVDRDEADEVVQEARLAWWRRPPRDARRARSWLGTVVRNAIRSRRRTQMRRVDLLGRAGPQPEPTPSAEALAEQLEVHRELARAVAELGEPFRQVVLRRYYEGLSAAEIARRLRVPAGTIRWRLKTGLDRLRVALDARYGERRAWLILLGPLGERADASPLPAHGPGARLHAPLVVTAGALLAGALGLAGWWA
jgi:RNA polymerase sigma factor (sigma-70 family)